MGLSWVGCWSDRLCQKPLVFAAVPLFWLASFVVVLLCGGIAEGPREQRLLCARWLLVSGNEGKPKPKAGLAVLVFVYIYVRILWKEI